MKRTPLGFLLPIVGVSGFLLAPAGGPFSEAPTGFDNLTNGAVLQSEMDAGHQAFIETEGIADGLGPTYNATSCVSCHQSIADGGASQIKELRAGHIDRERFIPATVTLADGVTQIHGRSLVNQRAICTEAVEQLDPPEDIRATRLSLSLFGDSFVEAVADTDFLAISREQTITTHGRVHGEAILVPILEGSGRAMRVGRFGWKDQHASLLSFSADAYLNEMGITNPLQPTEATNICNPAGIAEPNNSDDIFKFATFLRGLKAPPQDTLRANSSDAQAGAVLFRKIGCETCHVATLNTVPPRTTLNDGTFIVPDALGNLRFHPYSDFLLHDIGTGDGIVQNGPPDTRNKVRTMPLWGLRTRVEFLHDGRALDLYQAIELHRNEADESADLFDRLSTSDKASIMAFLKSL
jgi:CxxC motif-containing protein (DUF1111 family)